MDKTDHENEVKELENAFQLFNQMSDQLAASYQQLEGRVSKLSSELDEANDERQQELEEKERIAKRLQSLLQTLPAGVVVIDASGMVQESNPAAIDLLGEPLTGEAWFSVIQRAFSPKADDGHDLSLKSGRRVHISTSPLAGETGQIILIHDVTETRDLQEKLSQHQRLSGMGEMAASLAHQIRTPLASAMLYASHLKRTNLSEADRLKVADKIMARVRHLEHVVNDMLMFSRGGLSGNDRFKLAELIGAVTSSVESQLVDSQITLVCENHAEDTLIEGNREMLLSGLQNLTNNAIQAMGASGTLVIAVEPAGTQLIDVLIKDNGPGIEEQAQQKIFDPFYTTRSDGTGLGLAVVRAIAQAHHGDIWLKSVVGEGSVFGVRLPTKSLDMLDEGSQSGTVEKSYAEHVQ